TAMPISRLRGRFRLYKGLAVMPTYHPAYLVKAPSAKKEVWGDLKQVLRHLGRELPSPVR
ncbi:MAG: uracil-DNA glycosylase, partial [Polyangiaceae bacterium]|nr:uracil-DNA glycosylase [Polyangiaceae bacterium]